MEFKGSKTYENLMRSFAGESQARNRYDIAASIAKKEGFYVIETVFKYTADQERAHAKAFYNKLKGVAGDTIDICGGYPVDLYDSTLQVLKSAQHNELEEWDRVYKGFGETAKEEGFPAIAYLFDGIARIEKVHADQFGSFIEQLESGTIFKRSEDIPWICTNCGHIHIGKEAPGACSVCQHPQGFFMPFSESFAE